MSEDGKSLDVEQSGEGNVRGEKSHAAANAPFYKTSDAAADSALENINPSCESKSGLTGHVEPSSAHTEEIPQHASTRTGETSEVSTTSESENLTSSQEMVSVKGRFKIQDEFGNVIPMSENLGEKDSEERANIEPVLEYADEKNAETGVFFVKNATIMRSTVAIDDDDLSSGKNTRSSTPFSESSLGLSDIKVDASEAEVLTSKNDSCLKRNKYERNLKLFLEDINSRLKAETSETDTRKCKHERGFVKKCVRSDGTVSNFLYCCGSIRKVTNVLRKMKISISYPSLFNDNYPSIDEPEIGKSEMQPENKDYPNKSSKSLRFEDTASKISIGKEETHWSIGKNIGTLNSMSTTITVHSDNIQTSTNLPCQSTQSSDVFKVPEAPGKSSKSVSSPQVKLVSRRTSQTRTECREMSSANGLGKSPRRPTDLNVSPRTSIYSFCPESPSRILRHWRSLPNMNRPPKKESKRSSVNFEDPKLKNSVKALFTGEMKPTTPESSMSSVVVENIENKFPVSHSRDTDSVSASKGKQAADTGHSSSINSYISQISCKSKIRKRLIFISDPNENTNVTPTLQEGSSSSMDVSGNIADLRLESPREPPPEFKLVISPPKRKLENAVQPSCSSPKKLRMYDTDKASVEEKLSEAGKRTIAHSTKDTSNLKHKSVKEGADPMDIPVDDSESTFVRTGVYLHASEEPVGQLEDELKAEPAIKRLKNASFGVEDISETSSDTKESE